MVEVKKYQLPPTALMPNSPLPLLHYIGVLTQEELNPVKIDERVKRNGWQTQWIFRYGPTQAAHYHSAAHECMSVLHGSATIRFGVADTISGTGEDTLDQAHEEGGIELQARAGDVFILPAGTAHKTFATSPPAEFKELTPSRTQGVEAPDLSKSLTEVKLDGFTMMGSYPIGEEWNFAVGGEDVGAYERVWAVPKPGKDPVLGDSADGICSLWQAPS